MMYRYHVPIQLVCCTVAISHVQSLCKASPLSFCHCLMRSSCSTQFLSSSAMTSPPITKWYLGWQPQQSQFHQNPHQTVEQTGLTLAMHRQLCEIKQLSPPPSNCYHPNQLTVYFITSTRTFLLQAFFTHNTLRLPPQKYTVIEHPLEPPQLLSEHNWV